MFITLVGDLYVSPLSEVLLYVVAAAWLLGIRRRSLLTNKLNKVLSTHPVKIQSINDLH